jgi:hypothetical protein
MTVRASSLLLNSSTVAGLVNVSYRQIDYLATKLSRNPGQGIPRRWTIDDVQRLRIAAALNDGSVGGHFPLFAQAVIEGPQPPDNGWVAYSCHRIAYGPSPAAAMRDFDGAVIARIPNWGSNT